MHISNLIKTAIEASKKAGKILKKGYYSLPKIIKHKQGQYHNIVTETDLKAEKTIISHIGKKYKNHNFICEESGNIEKSSSLFQWIIDPLDGTVNFSRKIPYFCVSIGIKKNHEIIGGVVYNPIMEELFVAEKGKGAYLNKKRIKVSDTSNILHALIAMGSPYNLKSNPENCIEKSGEILRLGVPIRRMGAAALDFSYIASSRFDVYFETNLKPWDCAAGKCIIEEAGGKFTNWKGEPFKLSNYNSILATNRKLHKKVLDIFGKE